jgi:serine phosphatase RsbU (regulator of sigma subunit)
MFSDGFTDQNNFERRKYTSARLTKILEEIGSKDIQYQSSYMNNDLDSWQNGEQQRDDITFIGLKIK